LSAIQTFYSHAKRSEQHKTATAQLGRVRREIEIFEQFPPQSRKEQEEKIRQINDEMSKIDQDAPIISRAAMVVAAATVFAASEPPIMSPPPTTIPPLVVPKDTEQE